MAHSDPMTWRPKDRRWTKYYNKKHHYVSHRQLVKAGLLSPEAPNTKDGTRSAMRKWWEQTKSAVDAKNAVAREPQQPEGIYLSGIGVDYGEDETPQQHRLRLRIAQKVSDPDGQLEKHVSSLIFRGKQRLEKLNAEPPIEQTIGPHVETFLAFKRGQAEAGERSLGRADCLRLHLERFLEWHGENHPVTDIGEGTVQQYYQYVLGEARKGAISRYYARDLFASFRQLVRWLASQRLIPIPLNMTSKEFGFKLGTKIKTFSDAEVRLLVAEANDRTKLYLLLALNCGFTQIDIAELARKNVDLKNGKLRHKRFKTETEQHVPTVTYPIWPETLNLIEEHLHKGDDVRNRHDEPLAFVSERGKPLVHKSYNKKGHVVKTDAVRNAFNRLGKKLQSNGNTIDASFKHLRKTASTKLEEHPTYGRYVIHFLGQSPDTVAGKHYVTPSQKQFEEAINWLRQQFQVGTF